MTNQVKLHVGYIGKTREGKRVEIVKQNNGLLFFTDVGTDHYSNGARCTFEDMASDIIGPWKEDAVTDSSGCVMCDLDVCDTTEYETGVWYGWNGGECPVHPETQGDLVYPDGPVYKNVPFADYAWHEALLFRIVTPYVEPRKPREWWIVGGCEAWDSHRDAVDNSPSWPKEIVHVREVIEADVEPEPKLEFFGISVDKFSTDDLQKLANDVAKELQRRFRFRMIEADDQ